MMMMHAAQFSTTENRFIRTNAM